MNSCNLGSTPTFFFFDLVPRTSLPSSYTCSGTSWISSLTLLGLMAVFPREAVLSRSDLLSDLFLGFYSLVIVLLLLSFSFDYLAFALELLMSCSPGFSGLFDATGVVFGTLLDVVILLTPLLLVLIDPSIYFLFFLDGSSTGFVPFGGEEGDEGVGPDVGRTGDCPVDDPQPIC